MWPFGGKKKNGSGGSEAEIIEQLRLYIRRDIAAGFRPIEDLSELAIEIVADEFEESEVRALAPAVLDEEISLYRSSLSSWPEVTDCDRLDAAFGQIERSGIVARQNALCCQTCAGAEVWNEVDSMIKDGNRIRGMTFYHEQDTESAVEGGGVYLAYGATEDSEDAAVAIGEEVRRVLEEHGLRVQWNGQLSQRIHVALNWKRRRSDVAA